MSSRSPSHAFRSGTSTISSVSTTSPSLSPRSDSSSSMLSLPQLPRTLSSSSHDEDHNDDDSHHHQFIVRKKAFILSLMEASSDKGYLKCKLCRSKVWGPNGKVHIEKCPVISKHRNQDVSNPNAPILHSINGHRIESEFFAKPKPLRPKSAKIPGFVMSNTVLLSDATVAPNARQLAQGARVGRKGYTRCIHCNSEVFAPNSKRHAQSCDKGRRGTRGKKS